MPERRLPRLDVLAELHLEIDGDQGFTHVHVTGGGRELLVEVDDPVVALNSGLRARHVVGAVRAAPEGLLSDLTVRVRSLGRDLAAVRFDDAGRVSVRPRPAGLRVAARVGLSRVRIDAITAVAGGVVLAGLVALAVHQRQSVSRTVE
ncbi:MAG: hypothetical protein ABI181_10035 [Mycobacteriaceae bacterium]